MIRSIAFSLLLSACIAQATPLQLRWTSETSSPQPWRSLVFRGETVGLNATLTQYGRPLTLTTNATATMYWQTPDMGSAWWSTDATISTSGVAAATWTPAMDSGADLYSFFLGVEEADARTYRAYGQLRMQAAPGATPNEIDLPARWIDFDLIDVLNAPWATPADVATATAGMLTAEGDPVAYPIATNALAVALAHAAATNNPHKVTAAQIGALTAEADTLATVMARGGTTTEPMTIGTRGAGAVGTASFAQGIGVVASGNYSHSQGGGTTSSGNYSHSQGDSTTASGYASHAQGGITTASGSTSHAAGFRATASHAGSWAWQGTAGAFAEPFYTSHGNGTFNIAPVGGLAGFFVGDTALSTTLAGKAATNHTHVIGEVVGLQAAVDSIIPPMYAPRQAVGYALTNTIALDAGKVIYTVAATNDTTLAFDFSAVDLAANVARWETWIDVASTNVSVSLPGTNVVQYLEVPDLSTTVEPQTLQVAWQAWAVGAVTNIQAHVYARNPEDE